MDIKFDGVPDTWEITTLGAVCTKITDGSHNPPPKQSEGGPMLSAVNISGNKIVFGNHRLIAHDDFERENKRTQVAAGDVLLTIVGTIGRAAVVPSHIQQFTLQRSVAVIKPREIDGRFLMHQLESPRTATFLNSNAKGTAQKGIYLRTLAETPLLLPPLNEQRRIVEKIETLFARLDKGEEALRDVQKLLARYRQSVLKAAVTGQLTADWRHARSLPEWDEVELDELVDFLTSGSRGWAKYYAPSGALFIRAQNLKHDRLDLEDVAYVSLPKRSEGTRTLVLR